MSEPAVHWHMRTISGLPGTFCSKKPVVGNGRVVEEW